MALIDRIVWKIETSLDQQLTLDALADRCAVSQHHMCRSFQQATGLSIMAYVRARRLTRAAHEIAAGNGDLLTVALDSGYGSHEAFTRAFSALFGVLPSTVAKAQSIATLTLMEPIQMKQDQIIDLPPHRLERHPAVHLAGLAINCTFENNSEIPNLWNRFAARMGELTPDPEDVAYGVCFNTDSAGNFRYLAGLCAPECPEGMETLDLAETNYAVFSHQGHISDFPKAVYTVWNKALPDAGLTPSGLPDFERYDSRFNAETGHGLVEIWVPVMQSA
ncbi:MAG: AraC family transcriptional regulator [Pseudomonadota bacterium]